LFVGLLAMAGGLHWNSERLFAMRKVLQTARTAFEAEVMASWNVF